METISIPRGTHVYSVWIVMVIRWQVHGMSGCMLTLTYKMPTIDLYNHMGTICMIPVLEVMMTINGTAG